MAASGDIWRDDGNHDLANEGGTFTYTPVASGQGVVRSIALVAQLESATDIEDQDIQLIVDGVGQTDADIRLFFGEMGSHSPGGGSTNVPIQMATFWNSTGSPAEVTGFLKDLRIPFDTSFAIKVTNNDGGGADKNIDYLLARVEFALI